MKTSPWWRAAAYLKPHRLRVAAILLLTLVIGAVGAAEPWLFGRIIDALGGGGLTPIVAAVGVLGGAVILKEIASAVNNWLTWRTRIALQQSLLETTVGRLQRLPMSYHRAESVGEVMTRVDRGIQGVVGALSELAFNVLPALSYVVMALVIMVRLEPRLAVLVIVVAPIPILIGALAAPEQTRRERELLGRWSRIYGRFQEVLHGILTVKSFGMEDRERERFVDGVAQANRIVVRGVARDTGIGTLRNLVGLAARLTALGYGGWLVARGETSVGVVVAFAGYVGGFFAPVEGLTGIYQTVRRGRVALDAVFGILDAKDDPVDAPDARTLGKVRGAVDFVDVTFGYDPHKGPVLERFDLRIPAGQTVAIVGPSGSGKSTLMGLLKRLYDPTGGSIHLDGVDLRHIEQRSLRQRIGVVLQDGVLFNETVRANIAYGRPEATDEDIVAAAKAANAHDFILQLPQGYDTVVGERGSRLSAGQRQRIGIARAVLKDPPILILDEATSALDAESEAAVQEALDRLLVGRTAFIIAHRLATVVGADRIVVLRDGRISEEGTHLELMQKGGYYGQLVRAQTGGLLTGHRGEAPSPSVIASSSW